jgi:hypothetical protein
MYPYPVDVFDGRGPRALNMPRSKSSRGECVSCEDMNLVAIGREPFGKVLN